MHQMLYQTILSLNGNTLVASIMDPWVRVARHGSSGHQLLAYLGAGRDKVHSEVELRAHNFILSKREEDEPRWNFQRSNCFGSS